MKKGDSLVILSGLLFTLFFVFYQINLAQAEIGGNTEEIAGLNEEIVKRKETIKQLEETIAKYQSNINQKQLETTSLKNQLSILDNRIAQTDADIELTQTEINKAQLEIEALQLSINDKKAVIDKQKDIIAAIIRGVYAEDQKQYLEIMFTNNSFSDFYNQVQYLENIYTDLGQSVKNLRLIKEDLDNKKAQVNERKKTHENLQIELENKRKTLGEQTGNKKILLVQTQSSEAKYKTLLESLKQQYKSIENEVRNYEDQVRKKLEQQSKINESDSVNFVWPVPSHYITATFHEPDYPFRNVFEHSGIDIRASQGTAIHAAAAGYVGRAKKCTTASCYSYILLVHSGDLSTLYGHLSSLNVSEDQFVGKGDIIGYSGGTPGKIGSGPFVTGPHLHFETRLNGIPVDPMNYLINS
ncbi:MAG: peptidoglycan DD-metalloendopeptidase family protein [Candidatus Magasanikbacteria bacterium]